MTTLILSYRLSNCNFYGTKIWIHIFSSYNEKKKTTYFLNIVMKTCYYLQLVNRGVHSRMSLVSYAAEIYLRNSTFSVIFHRTHLFPCQIEFGLISTYFLRLVKSLDSINSEIANTVDITSSISYSSCLRYSRPPFLTPRFVSGKLSLF